MYTKALWLKIKRKKDEGRLARHAAQCFFHRHYRCSLWLVMGHSWFTVECYHSERTAFYYISHFVIDPDIDARRTIWTSFWSSSLWEDCFNDSCGTWRNGPRFIILVLGAISVLYRAISDIHLSPYEVECDVVVRSCIDDVPSCLLTWFDHEEVLQGAIPSKCIS